MSHTVVISGFRFGIFNIIILLSIFCANMFFQGEASSQLCATLNSHNPPPTNNLLKIQSGEVIGILGKKLLYAGKTTPAYWTVEANCELKSCDGNFLEGNCTTISNGNSTSQTNWASVACKCSGDCTCSDVPLQANVCARVYLACKPGNGCNSCGSPYADLEPSPTALTPFPEVWRDQVVSFLVAKGCKLYIYQRFKQSKNPDTKSGTFIEVLRITKTSHGPQYKEWNQMNKDKILYQEGSEDVEVYDCQCKNSIVGTLENAWVAPIRTPIPSPEIPALNDMTSIELCAQLKSCAEPFSKTPLKMRAGTVIGDLGEEYSLSKKAWNIPAYWSVEPNCELRICDEAYLNGKCETLLNGSISPTKTWTSAKCKCSKECSCADVHLKRGVGARAYLKPGDGCNSCDSSYIELAPDDEHTLFPEIYRTRVASFLVRQNCWIHVYEGEDGYGIREKIKGPIHKEWSKNVGSYYCFCHDGDIDEFQGNATRIPTPPSTIRSLEIPTNIDGIMDQLAGNNFDHPGLLAALTSLMHRRSSKNVYILAFGSSSAGKRSAINVLLGKNILPVTDSDLSSPKIEEFRIPVQLRELGISNSELRIIDTPEMGRNLSNDALFLATMDDYLSNHEELNAMIPSLVLVFHHLTDNRLESDDSNFIRMVRSLQTFRDKISDENYSNVIFIFSHLSSLSEFHQKNPLPLVTKFKDVIANYTLFPKPIMTAVIENKTGEYQQYQLPFNNGNFELPNGDYFPQNLIHRFETITKNGNDKIGQAMVEVALRQKHLVEDGTANVIKYDLMINSTTHNNVTIYNDILTNATIIKRFENDVFSSISNAFKNFTHLMRNKHRNYWAMQDEDRQLYGDLQRNLYIRNIRSKDDVPSSGPAIMKLLNAVGETEMNAYLLEHGLNLKSPEMPDNNVIGHSYSLLKDTILPSSPFILDEVKTSPIGFLIANGSECRLSQKPNIVNQFEIFEHKTDYFQHQLQRLLGDDDLSKIANSTELWNSITGTIKNGYLIKDVSCGADNVCNFVVPRNYIRFECRISFDPHSPLKLTPEFIRRVNELKPFDEFDQENVEKWKRFFDDFGTHVVLKGSGGGRINFRFSIPTQTSPMDGVVNNVIKSVEFLENPVIFANERKENPKDIIANASAIPHTLEFHGGDQSYYVQNLSAITLDDAVTLFKKWEESLDFYPVVYPTETVLITKVIERFLWKRTAAKFDEPLRRLLTSNLSYIPPPPSIPKPE